MSVSLGQGGRPLSDEEKCSLYSVSSDEYFACLKRNNVQLFSPLQRMPKLLLILIILVVLHYFKVIKLPIIGDMIPTSQRVR